MNMRNINELLEQRACLCHVGQRLTDAQLEVDTQDRPGCLVRVADSKIVFERKDAGREPRQDDFEVGPLGLDERL